ncbi:MAG: hypothetical protein WA173_04015 [Pseudomonas sp.]|uniref:hypothetical protein n=1 Tax=Pseudomonas sp. TaxID=306 RepID=UPI003BB796C5
MPVRLFTLVLLIILPLLSSCGRNDPQAALEAAVQQLQDNIEAKRSSAVLEQLHTQFSAQQQYDREWAKRTMLALFMRHQNVSVIAFSKRSQIDPTYTEKGHTDAEIAVTGAAGLIPDNAAHYRLKLEWWLEDGEWQLARLNWE